MFQGRPNVLKTKLTDSGVLRKAIEDAKTIAPRTDGRIRRLDTPAESKPCAAPTPTPTPTPAPTPAAAAASGGRSIGSRQ
jgi:type V secretory pathway adhesin AidA